SVARQFGQAGCSATNDRRPAEHRLQHWEAETLVKRRENERHRARIQRAFVSIINVAGQDDAFSTRRPRRIIEPALPAREHESCRIVDSPAIALIRANDAGNILARLKRAEEQKITLRQIILTPYRISVAN